ncbi:MAG: ATP-binding cassette domain-containing protein [Cyclobacteriaceae bacterium]|nr:ATP-binding cassette domain-containing protein [Cyclobacteriaceae bacterium]MDW8330684.1 ATP-binding cassette domain-containing protein [Cyclobacteriaceae bacterium]
MLNNHHIVRILREAALLLKHSYKADNLHFVEVNNRNYSVEEFDEFKRDLFEAGAKIQLMLLQYQLPPSDFIDFLKKERQYVLAFRRSDGLIKPVLIHPVARKRLETQFDSHSSHTHEFRPAGEWFCPDNEEVIFLVIFPEESIVSDMQLGGEAGGIQMNPVTRLLRLLHAERSQINYILFYALLMGLLSLVLPLGIQSTIELISGGMFFSSVYVLITIIIIGVLIGGILQIMQITLVEHLQRRIFTKASLEFAYRIPRLKAESIISNYAPELINRFFDIITIQKGLPKLLIDLTSGLVQIFFGLILLSLYHPFFVFFSIGLLTFLFIIFYFTGPRGLRSSIEESKYKYKVVHWLEELARALHSFKLAGSTDLPIKKTDQNVNNYLKFRKTHFQVLITQYSFILLFKTLVIGGLLIVGSILVVDRQITLGQFVASEVVIILILNSIEKIIMYMDVIYDLLTAVDKVANVTDLPLERIGGLDLPKRLNETGYSIQVKNLRFRYPGQQNYALNGVSLHIRAGERVCLAGPGGSGKTTLANILSGIYTNYEGIVALNNYSLRDLDLTHLRNKIGKNISQEDIFDGTILENITVGKPMAKVEDAMEAIEAVGLRDELHQLPDGLNTHLTSGGKNLSNTTIHKLILARCLAKKPNLVILNDFFTGLKREAKVQLIQCVTDPAKPWTLIAVSNDPLIMQACNKVIVIKDGRIEVEGPYEELLTQGFLDPYTE